jgi:hypothetical protein
VSEKAEVIDTSRMEILSEFSSAADSGGVMIPYRIGTLGGDFIIAPQSSIAQKPQGKVLPENVNERTKLVFENGIKRDWWSGDIVFGLENFDAVLARLEEIYGARPARVIDLNELDFVSEKDKMSVRTNSVMPHNVGQPIVSLQISNYRLLTIDDADSDGWHLYVTPETGEKLVKEMQKISRL